MLQTVRQAWSLFAEKVSGLSRWEGWRWLSQWALAIGHWVRGHSFTPRWGLHGDALAVTLPPLRHGGEEAEATRALLRRRRMIREAVAALTVPFRLAILALALLVVLPAALGLLINLVVFIPVWVSPEKTLALGFSEVSSTHLFLCNLLVLGAAFTRGGLSRHHQLS